ncbi:uncharacterized protein DDB_G0290685-like [Ruditapes philippinarum]|uniref:uncharacterized protein DDB_G0290685-like n=1 Tax=Ruditapes philippinarum TaxID=129788 RepID=UPI00295C2A68|nr:uncharacterized protein DDB_G0290685-like [Ruditapes philippinarum]
METSSSEKMNNVVGDDLSWDLGNKNRNTDDNSERCLTKDNKTDYTKEINESVNSQPAEEGYQGGEGIPEGDEGGEGIPEGDKDGGGIQEGNKDGVGIQEGNKDGVGTPEGDKDGVGTPEGDKDGVGIPEGDKDGVGIPEGDKGGGGIQEFDKEKQNESLRQKSNEDALIQNKDSQDNGTNITPNMNNDFDGNQYSHAVEVKDTHTTISVPGNLVIIDVTSTPSENLKDNVQERHETGQSESKMEDTSEPAGTANSNNSSSKEREDALAALRQGQTYDEDEDFEEDYFDVEKFNKAREKYVYFWKNYDIYSQWHKSEFQVHGKKFCNAEQYMMFKKAELFEDREIANQVLKCKDPKKIKAFGRKVRGFNQEIWQQHCLYIVKEGNREKFLQNNDYLADLLLTYPKVSCLKLVHMILYGYRAN